MLLVFTMLLFRLGLPVARAEPLDRIVAVVESELVMMSEVRLEQLLAPIDESESPFWGPTNLSAERRLIEATVFRVAAADIALYQPSPHAVMARREQVRLRFRDADAWRDFLVVNGVNETTLEVVIQRRMVVERFLARNIQSHPNPDNPTPWLEAVQRLESGLEARMRVRLIVEHSP